jgi:2-hydroxychromene-2-carboxylate isomerase
VEGHDVACQFRPVYPAVIRNPGFFESVDPRWFSYFRLDMRRSADFAGVPFRWPSPDPVAVDASGKALAEQPLIRRLTRLGAAANDIGRGSALAAELGRLMWSGRDNWHFDGQIEAAAARAGLPVSLVADSQSSHVEALDQQIDENERAHAGAGHWGVPLLVFNGEPFFGQDRFEMFQWRLRQAGLRERVVPEGV